MDRKIIDGNTYTTTTYTIAKRTTDYRLCKKSNGELVLQKLYEELDAEHRPIGEYWQDIETVEETDND